MKSMKALMMATSIFLTGLGQAEAAWLSICPDQPAHVLEQPAAGYRSHVMQMNGNLTLLQITAAPLQQAACKERALPAVSGPEAVNILWAALVPELDPKARSVMLQGTMRENRFIVSEIIGTEPAPGEAANKTDGPQPVDVGTTAASRAAWFWSPGLWLETPQQIFDTAATHKIRRVYITVPVEEGRVKHGDDLAAFIRQARQHDITVWAVLGDPAAVLPEGQRHFAALASAYASYNATAAPESRLGGLQLDIEPYLLPGYQLAPAQWQARYVDTIQAIHRAAPQLALDLALPFWWGETAHGGASLLDRLSNAVSGITVMDYRTDAQQIREFAQPFLHWGEQHGKAISIALEALPIADEERRAYFRAERGELLQMAVDEYQLLILLDKPVSAESARSYRYSHGGRFNGSTISFSGRIDELMKLLPELEAYFSRWSSFSGMALHGLQ